jgi:hypothetical protein
VAFTTSGQDTAVCPSMHQCSRRRTCPARLSELVFSQRSWSSAYPRLTVGAHGAAGVGSLRFVVFDLYRLPVFGRFTCCGWASSPLPAPATGPAPSCTAHSGCKDGFEIRQHQRRVNDVASPSRWLRCGLSGSRLASDTSSEGNGRCHHRRAARPAMRPLPLQNTMVSFSPSSVRPDVPGERTIARLDGPAVTVVVPDEPKRRRTARIIPRET